MRRDCRLVLGVLGLMSASFPVFAQQPGDSPVASVATPAQSDATVQPAAVAPVVSDPIAVAIKDHLQATTGEKADLAAARDFYAARNHAPLWFDGADPSPRARLVLMTIKSADQWGLTASDFALPALDEAATSTAKAEGEVSLTLAALKYARHARGGRVNPTALTIFLDRKPPVLPAAKALDLLAKVSDPGVALIKLHPQHPQFERLRQAYLKALATGATREAQIRLPDGPTLKIGSKHAQVALLRKRLKVVADASVEATYDTALADALKTFQSSQGLKSTGILDGATRRALNAQDAKVTPRQLLANMEQWRWMPEDLGAFHVWVNVPEFQVRVMRDGAPIHTEKIIAGKVTNQTPIFSHEIQQVIFHPFWGVPDSIKQKELLPSLARNPGSLARNNLRIQQGGRDIDPATVDWTKADIRRFHVYQPPGAGNVLGVVKFRFENKHQVYMHDTPTKSLFSTAVRAYSHGCMRVQDPLKLASLLLEHDRDMPMSKVKSLAAPNAARNNTFNLTRKVPVHMTYFTVTVDDAGTVHKFRDIYGHEERIALGLEGKLHMVAKVPSTSTIAQPVSRLAETKPSSSGGSLPSWARQAFGNNY